MSKSTIEWTESTWNPVTGCDSISPGCDHCYARVMANRLQAMGQAHYSNGFRVTLHEDFLDLPTKWTKPQRIFVNSMSDWCHEEIPTAFILSMFRTMLKADWHIYQLLTKRAPRMVRLVPQLTDLIEEMTGKRAWPAHIWLGTTVESYVQRGRVEALRKVPARIRFISYEPALGPLAGVDLSGIHWLICGAESGIGARPMKEEWARDIKDQCVMQGVRFFLKQYAHKGRKIPLPHLDGKVWNEFPKIEIAPEAVQATLFS